MSGKEPKAKKLHRCEHVQVEGFNPVQYSRCNNMTSNLVKISNQDRKARICSLHEKLYKNP